MVLAKETVRFAKAHPGKVGAVHVQDLVRSLQIQIGYRTLAHVTHKDALLAERKEKEKLFPKELSSNKSQLRFGNLGLTIPH